MKLSNKVFSESYKSFKDEKINVNTFFNDMANEFKTNNEEFVPDKKEYLSMEELDDSYDICPIEDEINELINNTNDEQYEKILEDSKKIASYADENILSHQSNVAENYGRMADHYRNEATYKNTIEDESLKSYEFDKARVHVEYVAKNAAEKGVILNQISNNGKVKIVIDDNGHYPIYNNNK